MSAIEVYPSAIPAFSLTTSTTAAAAAAAAAADRMKSDFQTALRRNLHNWAQWRIQLNDNLADAVMTGCRMAEVEPIGACLDRAAPHPGHPTNNPKTLLTYSATANSSTPLQNDEFFKYGIPRARVNLQLQQQQLPNEMRDGPEAVDCRLLSHSAPDLGNGRRHIVANAATVGNRRLSFKPEDHLPDDDEDDELVLDYFDFDDTPSSSTSKLGPRRRFHRSAATLPTVPSWGDNDTNKTDSDRADSRRRISASAPAKKATDRRRQMGQLPQQQAQKPTAVPSYAEPFSRQRIITARRDDVMYTNHNAWRVDEL